MAAASVEAAAKSCPRPPWPVRSSVMTAVSLHLDRPSQQGVLVDLLPLGVHAVAHLHVRELDRLPLLADDGARVHVHGDVAMIPRRHREAARADRLNGLLRAPLLRLVL